MRTGRCGFVSGAAVAVLGAGCRSPEPAGPSQATAPAIETTAGDANEADAIEERLASAAAVGRQLYVLDEVAALATDKLFEEIGDPADEDIAGYIAYREGDEAGQPKDAWIVAFYTSSTPPAVAHEVRVFEGQDREPEREEFDPAKPAAEGLAVLIRARETALAALRDVEQPINTVVLPESDGPGILVYLLAGSAEPNVAVMGRHSLARISADGSTVVEMRTLSRTVLEISTFDEEGREPEALAVTSVDDDLPSEIHVFLSLLHQLPVFVGTSRGVWRVDGDEISRVDPEAAGS